LKTQCVGTSTRFTVWDWFPTLFDRFQLFCVVCMGCSSFSTVFLRTQVPYSWCTSVIIRHRLVHSYAGNGTTSHDGFLSPSQLMTMYNMLTLEREVRLCGAVKRTFFRLRTEGTPVSLLTVRKWAARWSADNEWRFFTTHLPRPGRPPILSAAGRTAAAAAILGNTCRGTVRKRKFEAADGEGDVPISRQTLSRIAVAEKYEISTPKRRRIRVHFSHHRIFRVSHCRAGLTKDDRFLNGLWYSDEQPYPVTLGFNSKNDIQWVTEGTRSTTNHHRHSKGDDKKAFNLWWVVSPQGVVCFLLYQNFMNVDFFHELMMTYVKPARNTADGTLWPLTAFYHDKVTNSNDLFDPTVMDECCGKGRWLQFSPAVCREDRGKKIHVEATDRACAYDRKQTEACLECKCDDTSPQMLVPTASPELNIAENAQGELLRRLT